SSQILGRIERSATNMPYGSCSQGFPIFSRIITTDGLGIVLNHIEVELFGDGHDLIHGRSLAIQMHGYDGFGAGGDSLAKRCRIHTKTAWVHFHKYRLQSQKRYHFGGGYISKGRSND